MYQAWRALRMSQQPYMMGTIVIHLIAEETETQGDQFAQDETADNVGKRSSIPF